MCETKIKNVIINIYTIFIIVNGGLIGIFTFSGIIKECCVEAQNIIVDCQGNGNYTTIQEAITYANPGDFIYVWDGIYNENIAIDKTLTLIGNGTHSTTINGSGTGDVVYITANWVNITGFTIQNSGDDKWIYYDSGIEVATDYNHVCVFENHITKNTHGIFLKDSDYGIIKNNNISNNGGNGLYCRGSDSNVIIENNCIYNFVGINTYCSYSNSIFNNTCNFNEYDGISIIGWNDKISNNTCNFNKWNGITLSVDASADIISNNICNSNEKNGIFLDIYNDHTIIINNTCNLNWDDGIEIKESTIIEIKNNTCNSNLDTGLELFKSGSISIFNNSIIMNKYGISLFESNQNVIWQNNITNNIYGIYLEQTSSFNKLLENFISTNSNTGIFILSNCNSNFIYHNLIISNTKQASDFDNNTWSYQSEGNYWSDYFGLDNGANGRWKGDGIGDTNIPHPGAGYDNYPFIKPYGWRFPAIPELIIESDIDSDGNFTVSWNNKSRAIGFFFETDTEILFTSPTNYTKGWLQENGFNIFHFFNKQEDTYYYRIKSYNDYYISAWSDIVNVTVDYLPKIPENLKVSPVSNGNTLNISWNPNLKDTIQYGLYFLNDLTWEPLKNLTHPTTTYEHTGLKDGVSYSYKVCAIDSIGQSSNFSEIVSGIPKDIISPDVPKNLKATAISNHEIKLTWDTNIEPDLAGYLIYINDSGIDKSTIFILNKTIYAKETSCIISGLNEQITYLFKIKAFDEVPNNSTFSELAWATTFDLTPPKPPSDLKISNETYNSLTISWQPSVDRDVIGYIVYQSTSLFGEYENRTGILSSTQYIDTGLNIVEGGVS